MEPVLPPKMPSAKSTPFACCWCVKGGVVCEAWCMRDEVWWHGRLASRASIRNSKSSHPILVAVSPVPQLF